MMKVVFIGAGNVATHLAVELYKKGFDIIQVYSYTLQSATKLARQVDAAPINDLSVLINDADLYIFSLKDSVLEDVISKIPANNGLWIHTAGSMPLTVFENQTKRYGVVYPFQTFSKDREVSWNNIPIFIEASDNESLSLLMNIVKQLSSCVMELSSDKRRYVHITGVFACNFTNHMYRLSSLFLEQAGLSLEIALPLIDETASKVHTLTPQEAQTGPAIRYDENIINKHLELIEDKDIKDIYKQISINIHKLNNEQ